METLIALCIVSAVLSYFASRFFARYFKDAGIVARDLHKEKKPVLPTSAGIALASAFYLSVLGYVFLRVYYFKNYDQLLEVFASLLSILVITFVGFLDDVNVKGTKRIGLKQWQKPLFTLPAALPLMAVKLGTPTITLPFVGTVDVGVLYPLVLVPIGVVGGANMVNLLAGLNGLESGLAVIYLSALNLILLKVNAPLAAKIIGFAALGAVLGFLPFNLYPARFLPGDSLTYFLGALIANLAIVGNIEKPALILSVPFIIEFFLKARGLFKKPTVGYIKNGKIYRKTKGIYSIPHFWMNGKYTEPQIVFRVWLIQLIFAVLAVISAG